MPPEADDAAAAAAKSAALKADLDALTKAHEKASDLKASLEMAVFWAHQPATAAQHAADARTALAATADALAKTTLGKS